jgi:actin-like ATPase involved in cell morphogenesis
MTQIVGIDLGTTNSCVAVPEAAIEPGRRQELLAARRLRQLAGTLILTDRLRAPTVPSAVWMGLDGTVLTGRAAKQRATTGQGRPALFFKREMGTSTTVHAGQQELSAEEASAHVLRHVKGMAEELLEDDVGRAVITVPAFFTLNARLATKRAGERAGLDVLDVLLEPVAAALAYTHTITLDEPRKFMVYDLGGGTFDVSVVTWDAEDDFQMRSFHGDPLLGGFNLDQEIVNWIIRQVGDDYDLGPGLDLDDPADVAVFSRLMVIAEAAKQQLSQPGDAGLEVEIVDTTGTDRAGTPMHLQLTLTRDEFEQLIDAHVERTMASCQAALTACDGSLAEAGIGPLDLSDIIMVGGSSRMPLIAERLRERFGLAPRLLEPDLCIAAGAALKVASLGSFGRHLQLDPVAVSSAEPSVDVGGRVLSGGRTPSVAGVTVLLTAGRGAPQRTTVEDDGHFVFPDVPLRPGPNNLVVTVLDGDDELERLAVDVEHDPEDDGQGRSEAAVPDVLPHDIAVATRSGLSVVAGSGTRLPAQTMATFYLVRQRGEVAVELYEGNSRIGAVHVRNLPPSLPYGTPVLVDLAFHGNWTIDASARIPAAGEDAVGVATIDIPTIEVPDWPDLGGAYQEVLATWGSMRPGVPPGERLRMGPRIDELLREIGDLVNQRQDRRRAHHLLGEVQTMLLKLPQPEAQLDPPPDRFGERLDEADRLVQRLEGKDPAKAAEFRTAFAAIQAAGEAAQTAGNQQEWTIVTRNLGSRIWQAERLLREDRHHDDPLDPAQLRTYLAVELAAITRDAEDGARLAGGDAEAGLDHWRSERDRIEAQLRDIDIQQPRASHRLSLLWEDQIRPFRARVEQWLRGLGEDTDIATQRPEGPGVP